MTINLTIPTIVCDRCVQAVTQAIHSVDAQATVNADLATKQVTIETTVETLTVEILTAAIDAAGHEVEPTL